MTVRGRRLQGIGQLAVAPGTRWDASVGHFVFTFGQRFGRGLKTPGESSGGQYDSRHEALGATRRRSS